jgi:hypothetical protein
VGIPPFFKGSVTHPNLTAFTHPNAGVFARVLRKQDTGKHSPKSSTMSASLWSRRGGGGAPPPFHPFLGQRY